MPRDQAAPGRDIALTCLSRLRRYPPPVVVPGHSHEIDDHQPERAAMQLQLHRCRRRQTERREARCVRRLDAIERQLLAGVFLTLPP
jgi:hypothetical protein